MGARAGEGRGGARRGGSSQLLGGGGARTERGRGGCDGRGLRPRFGAGGRGRRGREGSNNGSESHWPGIAELPREGCALCRAGVEARVRSPGWVERRGQRGAGGGPAVPPTSWKADIPRQAGTVGSGTRGGGAPPGETMVRGGGAGGGEGVLPRLRKTHPGLQPGRGSTTRGALTIRGS